MEFKEKKPIYRQIADHVSNQILDGYWEDGQRIASIRELAVSLEVNPNTVTRAYQLLQDEGIIENRRGVGYFTADNAKGLSLKLKRQEFIGNELPEVFETMQILQISIEELKALYDKFQR